MNDLMSGFQHRCWKSQFVSEIVLKPNLRHLDMATGTGDIVRKLVKRLNENTLSYHITACDLNKDMLELGKNKLFDQGIFKHIDWHVADAENLPFEANYFDSYSIAFGIRNVTDPLKALKEAHRCLKPGGAFYCLEFSQPESGLFKNVYDLYAFSIIPRIGALITQNKKAYTYLAESIETFLAAHEFESCLKKAGFMHATSQPFMQGLVRFYKTWKET
jgi:demethylmenaquinone methyltransferase/2-methoxy-6-polyprenyl-1,4-benzoquinol methylase